MLYVCMHACNVVKCNALYIYICCEVIKLTQGPSFVGLTRGPRCVLQKGPSIGPGIDPTCGPGIDLTCGPLLTLHVDR